MKPTLQIGMDVLLREHVRWLRGARVGLVAHGASVDAGGCHSLRRLADRKDCSLTCLFGPEHGFAGAAAAGEKVGHVRHAGLGIPVYSLYGATRTPTARMLDQCDVIVVDLQDLGVRCYTYVSTLLNLLKAAAARGKTLVVADRPIPFPNTLDGPMLEPALKSFVGAIPAPLVYGMTPGETALWLKRVLNLDLDLRVASMQGYERRARRGRGWPRWIPPSPAIKRWATAWTYPATVFCEAMPSLDCGRAGPRPFETLGAEWMRGDDLCAALSSADLPGVRFETAGGERRNRVRLVVEDAEAFLPVTTGVAILCALRDLHGEKAVWHGRSRPEFFDQLMGSSQVRREWTAGEDHAWITAAWTSASAGFRADREKALLYGERAARPVPRRGPRVQWPRKAVVLAAGFGTRMNPLSGICAKPLMPLWGKPALQHVLESLASWGVEEVVINSHHQPGQVLDFVRGQPLPGMKLDLSYEPDILGTGGALRKLSWFLGEEPFWMMNADVAADLDPRPLVEDFGRGRRLASLWLHADAGPRTVEMDRSLVRTFRSRRAGSRGTYTFTGLHLLSKDVLDYLPESGFATIIGAYEAGMKEGRKVGGVHVPGAYWRDLGSPDDYIRAHREVRVRFRSRQTGARLYDPSADGQRAAFTLSGVRVGGFLAAAPGVELAPGAAVKDSVLWPNVRVGPRARIEHAVVGDGATVSGPVTHIAAPAVASLDEQARDALRALGMNAARATWSLIGVRGSQRTFSRVSCGGRSVVLVQYSRERKENLAYARYARFLGSAGFPVPGVLLDRPRQCLTILQDLGDRSLEETVRRASPRKIAGLYGRVLESVALLHTRATGNARACGLRLQPPFTRALYRWENDLFAEEFLAGRNGVDARRLRVIKQELRANAERLLSAKRVLLHRDLQSSNVLLTARGHAFIDFQGMRMGAAAYDLASLLCDPYVSLGREQQEALLDTYVRLVPDGPEVRDLFWPAAVQRLAQALGAFARLSRLPDNARFEQYIPAGMAMLGRAARCVGGMPELRAMLGETDPPQAPGR